MKILYIDPESFFSHKNYNKLQISALLKLSYSIQCCFKKGYLNTLDIEGVDEMCAIPNCLYIKSNNGLLNRVMMLLRYWFIIIRILPHLHDFDVVIISYYDEIAILFAPFPKGTYLINHINIAEIYKSKIKRFFFKWISKRYTHIVFDDASSAYLNSIGITKTHIVKHGIIEPFANSQKTDNIIFCPSSSSADSIFMTELINNKEFRDLLIRKKYKLILRGKYNLKTTENIIILDNFLEDDEYQNLFSISKFILLPYHNSFMFRTSGVLLEGIANRKVLLVRSLPSLLYYKKYYENLYGFTTVNEFVEVISKLIDNKSDSVTFYINVDSLQPDYSFLETCNVSVR